MYPLCEVRTIQKDHNCSKQEVAVPELNLNSMDSEHKNIAGGWWRVATNPDKKQVWATSVEDEPFEAWTHNAVTLWHIILCSDAPEADKGCACPQVTPAEKGAAPLWKTTVSAKQQQLWPAFSSAAYLDPLKSMLIHASKGGRNHLRSVIMPPLS